MRTLAFLLLSAAATGTDLHALRSAGDAPNRRLQNNNGVDIVEYCGQCIWRGRIVCEARAQFLVREYGDMTLEEARISILDECTADGSDISLDAYCGDCPWLAMNYNCDARVAYLMQTYQLSEEQAQQAMVERGECIDPEYVPVELREPEDSDSGGGLSGGAIVEPSLVPPPIDPMEHQKFADDLTALMHEKDNECSSALGVSMAFSLIWPGATNNGTDEIRDTLGYPNGSNMRLVWDEVSNRMTTSYGGQCLAEWDGVCNSEAPLLEIAYTVWFHDDKELQEEYEAVVGDYAKQIDFEADDSPAIVNQWVNKSTNGLIETIVPEDEPLFPPHLLLAINSIYLKARWHDQFQPYNTNLDSFYASPERSIDEVASDAHFMNTVEHFSYSHDAIPGHQVINLLFASSEMSMVFVLPMSDGTDAVQSTALIPALEHLQMTRVALSLPKFKFQSKYEDTLEQSLFDLGIQAPFTEGAEALCGIFDDYELCPQLVISKVIQKTFIDCNEEGVEAAAVTMVGVGLTSAGPPPDAPVLMQLNHPFQFFIYDRGEGVVLFEGRVGAPGVPEAEPDVALLDAKHSDADFWSNRFGVDPVEPAVGGIAGTASTVVSTTSPTTVSQEIFPSETSPPATSNPTPQPSDPSESSTKTPPTNAPASTSPTSSANVITAEIMKCLVLLTVLTYVW